MSSTLLIFVALMIGWLIGRHEAQLLAQGRRLFGAPVPPVERQTANRVPLRSRIDHRAAVHEAGHAVCAWFNPYVVRIDYITLDDGSTGTGRVHQTISSKRHRADARWALIATDLGGIAAEVLEFGVVRSGPARGDLIRARDLAVQLVAEAKDPNATTGSSPWDHVLPDEPFDVSRMLRSIESDSDEARILNICYVRAKHLIESNPTLMERTVKALLQEGRLERDQIDRIFGRRPFFW